MIKKTIITISLMIIVFFGIGISVNLYREYQSLGYSSDVLVSTKELVNNEGVALENYKDFCVEYMEINKTKSARKVFYNNCSKNKPAYCDNGNLLNKCDLCGCFEGETCSKNGECKINNDYSIGGISTGVEGSASEGAAGGAGAAGESSGAASNNDCYDTDISTNPNPIYENGQCTDLTGSFNDGCEDPISGAQSTSWVKEFKCQKNGNTSICVATFKNCPSNTLIYFLDSNSQCESNKCSEPTQYQQNNTINATCIDGILNQDETGIDCEGVCGGYYYTNSCHSSPQVVQVNVTCSDGIRNQDETGIDCGGVCGGYYYTGSCHSNPQTVEANVTCSDGIRNQDETGIDCGGVCVSCQGNGGGNSNQTNQPKCYVDSLDQHGLTIFTASNCHDESGVYANNCISPVYGDKSNIFIKTYLCLNDKCVSKYYSCVVKGKELFLTDNYYCKNNVCIN